MRLDIHCVQRGLFESRQKAQASIMAGLVLVNGKVVDKAGQQVQETDIIEIIKPECPYVSRGGLKLKSAIDNFKINVQDKICLDVGASTGGFTDCFLQEGARKVYAVDVGEGKLHEKIKDDPKVVFLPHTNARFLKPELFPRHYPPLRLWRAGCSGGQAEKPQIAAIDVSFISLCLVLKPVFDSMDSNADVIALVKPQFELEPKDLKKGIVKNEGLRLKAIESLRKFAAENIKGIEEKGLMNSPIKGAKGNLEFLWYLHKM
jgi:23S rRNA (cytidine1920-2'-O)/16S rRNA (cytidine1409-2'-O)-methyltransferase